MSTANSLQNLAQAQNSPHAKRAADIYTRLRHNLVTNIYKSWEETGFAWEQYNPEDGHGQRTQHFTGWTSLVVKVMGMPEKPLLATVSVASDPRVEKKLAKEKVAKEKKEVKEQKEEDEVVEGPEMKKESVLEMAEDVVGSVEEAVEQFVDAFAGGDMEDHDEL